MKALKILLGLFFITITAQAQLKSDRILLEYFKKRDSFTSVTYDVNYYLKSFSMEDTVNWQTQNALVRIPEDTLFHGHVWLNLDTMWLGYDGLRIMKYNKLSKILTYDNAIESPGLYIKTTVYNALVEEGFLTKNQSALQLLHDPEFQTSVNDTIIGGRACLGLTYYFPDTESAQHSFYFLALDTLDLVMKKKVFSSYFQGNQQYQEWNYANVRFGNETSIPGLNVKAIPDLVREEKITYLTSDINKANDFDYSTLKGQLLSSGTGIELKELHFQFFILDFWYTSCYPCIKSIPALTQLHEAYKEKGVKVLGVNIIDELTKSKVRLDKFQINNPMPYETIMAARSLENEMGIGAYPTLMILDRNYKMIYKEEGFNEHLFDEVSTFLNYQMN